MLTFHDDDVQTADEADTDVEAFPDLDGDVRQSIARIKASPFIPNMIAKLRLRSRDRAPPEVKE